MGAWAGRPGGNGGPVSNGRPRSLICVTQRGWGLGRASGLACHHPTCPGALMAFVTWNVCLNFYLKRSILAPGSHADGSLGAEPPGGACGACG